MELGKRIVTIAVGSIFVTSTASLLVQRSLIRKAGIQQARDTMRATLLSAENTRESISGLRKAGAFDDPKLKEELGKTSDYRQSTIYLTVPVVAAWNSIIDVAAKEDLTFRVPAEHPRNPKNAPTEDEHRILSAIDNGKLPEFFEVNDATNEIVYARPIRLSSDCMSCHGDPANSITHNGKDMLGFQMEGWHEGDLHGVFLLRSKLSHVDAAVNEGSIKMLSWLLPLSIGIGIGVYFLIAKISGRLRQLTESLADGASQVTDAAAQIAQSSKTLAEGASTQASSIMETSAATQEVTSMAQKNAVNSTQAAEEMDEVSRRVQDGNSKLTQMIASMGEINESSAKISKIISVIDGIAFQTNILALNASVEAARAGEAGAGFSVVADEVRSLAMRSAQAAKDISGLIEESLDKSKVGSANLERIVTLFGDIRDSAGRVQTLINDVKSGSTEQSKGIEQALRGIHDMERVTQSSAANAEQSAATSVELTTQAESMNQIAQELKLVVEGTLRE